MVKKIGVDIVENQRIAAIYKKYGEKFAKKILTDNEFKIFQNKIDQVGFLSSRWAGKEAVGKALSSGLSCGIKNIEILNYDNGQPYVILYNEALEKLQENDCTKVEISISHERLFSVAFVITL
ncbi:MAG: holo-ACP synthase [Halanaerobiales bacterium]